MDTSPRRPAVPLLRPEREDDDAFLFRLFCDGQDAALARLPEALLRAQWAAQRAAYRTRDPACRFSLLEWDGVPAGRLVVQREHGALRIVDLAVATGQRRCGRGSWLVEHVIAVARGERLAVTLSVALGNPAMNLYERLGFREVARSPTHVAMIRGLEQDPPPL